MLAFIRKNTSFVSRVTFSLTYAYGSAWRWRGSCSFIFCFYFFIYLVPFKLLKNTLLKKYVGGLGEFRPRRNPNTFSCETLAYYLHEFFFIIYSKLQWLIFTKGASIYHVSLGSLFKKIFLRLTLVEKFLEQSTENYNYFYGHLQISTINYKQN